MSTLCPQQFLDSPYQLRPRYDMMLRRLFALGAAPLSHVAWCAPGDFIPAPPFTPRPGFLFRDGTDGKGYYRVANSPEAPSSRRVREGVDSEGKLRFQEEHHKIFGSGFHHDVFWKCKIVQMWHGCQKFYDDREKRKKMPLIHDFFHNITGFYHQRVSEYESEIIANDGFLLPPDQRGRQVYMLENDYPGFEAWVDAKALEAMSGYLTVENLLPKFQEEFGVVISYHVLRTALVRLDFKYQKRERAYVSNKWKPEVLELLSKHCTLVYGKVEFNPHTKRWYFRNPTIFEDEAYILSGEMRSMSWCRQRNRYRNVMKGGNKRWCLVGSIFSHTPDGKAGSLAHWNMGWKTAKPDRPFFGKMDNKMLLAYFGDTVFPMLGQTDLMPTLFVDNWSVHKKFDETYGRERKENSKWLWEYMSTEYEHTSREYKAFRSMYVNLGGDPSSEACMNFIKEHRIPVRKLEKLCHDWNVSCRFLAPYWSPCNPVEFVWARLKQLIRDQDPSIPIEERINKAWSQITPKFVEECVDRSIRFTLSWYWRFRGAGLIRRVGAPAVESIRGAQGFSVNFGQVPVDPDSDVGSDSSDSDDDEENSRQFKRMKL